MPLSKACNSMLLAGAPHTIGSSLHTSFPPPRSYENLGTVFRALFTLVLEGCPPPRPLPKKEEDKFRAFLTVVDLFSNCFDQDRHMFWLCEGFLGGSRG